MCCGPTQAVVGGAGGVADSDGAEQGGEHYKLLPISRDRGWQRG